MRVGPYVSAEDSALLRRAIRGKGGGSFLEVGAGNGGTLKALSAGFALAVGTDIARPEMTDWRGGAEFVLADGASCFRDSCFDLVAFNPPYLAGNSDDPTVGGGERLETPKAFLRESLRVVKGSGEVVFLLSDGADLGEFRSMCEGRGFDLQRVMSERLFFEELTAFAARATG